jgi:prepilin-type N-terminal cleavage/methylation domain-containing protein
MQENHFVSYTRQTSVALSLLKTDNTQFFPSERLLQKERTSGGHYRRALPQPPGRIKSAFSIIELLMVIAIVGLLAAITGPAISSLTNSNTLSQTFSDLAGLLEQARAYAVANNTYVWVSFHQQLASGSNASSVSVAVVASQDGTDPNINNNIPYAYGSVPAFPLILISKLHTFPHIQLEAAGVITASQIPSLPSVVPAVTSSSNGLNSNSFSIQLPGSSSSSSFSQGFQFTPDGEARVGFTPVNVIEFDLQPTQGNAQDVAVFRVNGITGQTSVYRP